MISSHFPPAIKHARGLESIASVLPTSDVRHETHGYRKDRARLLERVFLLKFFNDNWVSIGQYDNCLALNDLKQEIVGIKDKADNRHVRVRAPSQLIFVAQAAEFNRTQRIVLYDFIYASKLLSTESPSEFNTANYSTSSKKTPKYAESNYGCRALEMIFHGLLFIAISMLLSTEFGSC